jgi:integrase
VRIVLSLSTILWLWIIRPISSFRGALEISGNMRSPVCLGSRSSTPFSLPMAAREAPNDERLQVLPSPLWPEHTHRRVRRLRVHAEARQAIYTFGTHVQLMLLTGCRAGEWARALWSWVDLKQKLLIIPAVGVTGFKLATPTSRGHRSTQRAPDPNAQQE